MKSAVTTIVNTDFSLPTHKMTTPDETSKPDSKYWRGSIALSPAHRPKFDKHMAALGLKTLGDLVLMVSGADETIVEALRPHADKYLSYKGEGSKVRATADKLKDLAPDQLDRLIELAKQASLT